MSGDVTAAYVPPCGCSGCAAEVARLRAEIAALREAGDVLADAVQDSQGGCCWSMTAAHKDYCPVFQWFIVGGAESAPYLPEADR